jgi:hypothetical protein
MKYISSEQADQIITLLTKIHEKLNVGMMTTQINKVDKKDKAPQHKHEFRSHFKSKFQNGQSK